MDHQNSNLWKVWLESCTIHGVNELIKPQYGKGWKICWAILLFIFTCLAVNNIIQVTFNFIKNPSVQEYSVEFSTTLRMPDVIICTEQKLDRSKLKEMGASDRLVEGLTDGLDDAVTSLLHRGNKENRESYNWTLIKHEYREFLIKNGITVEEMIMRTGVECEEIIQSCSKQDKNPENSEQCCKNAHSVIDIQYGKCYRFQLNFVQSWPGAGAGYRILIKQKRNNGGNRSGHFVKGILVAVRDSEETMIGQTYYRLSSGVIAAAHLELQKTFRKNLFGRKQTCRELAHTGRGQFDKLKATTDGCFYAVWAEEVGKHCNCSPFPNISGSLPICGLFDDCPLKYNSDALRGRQSDICIPACQSNSYRITMSYTKLDTSLFDTNGRSSVMETLEGKAGAAGKGPTWQSDRHYKWQQTKVQMDQNMSPLHGHDGLILLELYFPRMEFTMLREVEVNSISSLVSNIGGVLGLWLGASLMTFCQIILNAVKWVSIKINACGERQ